MGEVGPKTSSTGELIIDNEDYAFGLSIGKDFNSSYLEHSGLWASFPSHFIYFIEERLTIAVLSNVEDFDSEEYAIKMVEIILGKHAKK